MDKKEINGEVAVLYSPSFGAGWSTWNSEEIAETLLFHPVLVELVLSNKRELITEALCEEFCNSKSVSIDGADQLEVEWMPKGQAFRIEEHMGGETIIILDMVSYVA